jgi:hypothetical protein
MPVITVRCPACSETLAGARSYFCDACGFNVQADRERKRAEKDAVIAAKLAAKANPNKKIYTMPDGYQYPEAPFQRIAIAAGDPPIKLKIDEEDSDVVDTVINWAMNTRQTLLTQRSIYLTNDGLIYWLRKQLDRPSADIINAVRTLPDITYRSAYAIEE